MKMKIRYILIALAAAVAFSAGAQESRKERNLIKKGNEYFSAKKYSEAENCYNQAIQLNPNSSLAKYNLATTLLRKRTGKDAQQDSIIEKRATDMLSGVASDQAASNSLRQKSYYNMGKLAYDKENYQASVDYFKDALRVDPADNEARKNLRMAQKKLQDSKNDQDDKKDQKQDQQKQDQNQNQNQNQNQDQQKQDQPQPQQQPPQQQQPQSNAEQLLNAMQNEEKNTRDKVNKRKAEQMQGRGSLKPW